MTGRFPSCVLQLQLPNRAVDVNVHPAKTEVKFANERAVFDCVRFGVLGCLNKTPARPQMTLHTPAVQSAPTQKPDVPRQTAVPKQDTFRTMTAAEYKTFSKVLSEPAKTPVAPGVAQAFGTPKPVPAPTPVQPPVTVPAPAQPVPIKTQPLPKQEPPKVVQQIAVPTAAEPVQQALQVPTSPYRIIGEALNTYIIVEQDDNVLFLDKHAAHERILFEKLKKTDTDIMAQSLLTPATASLTKEEAAAVLENKQLLLKYGYEVDDFGAGDVIIRQIPCDLDLSQAEDALTELAQRLLEKRDPQAMRDELLHTIACKAAIKAGWHTTEQERAVLVKQVMEREDIKYCPHGRPVITTLSKNQLERQFKR